MPCPTCNSELCSYEECVGDYYSSLADEHEASKFASGDKSE